jgi:hypothetical protein
MKIYPSKIIELEIPDEWVNFSNITFLGYKAIFLRGRWKLESNGFNNKWFITPLDEQLLINSSDCPDNDKIYYKNSYLLIAYGAAKHYHLMGKQLKLNNKNNLTILLIDFEKNTLLLMVEK